VVSSLALETTFLFDRWGPVRKVNIEAGAPEWTIRPTGMVNDGVFWHLLELAPIAQLN